MSFRRTTASAISQGLALSSMDELLKQISFRRRKNTLVYRRSCSRLIQTVEICFDLSPRYQPRAIAHVLPQVCLECQELAPLIAEMTSSMPTAKAFSGRVAGMVLRQQVQNLAPREERLDWYLYEIDHAKEDLHPLKAFVAGWVIPFLEEYTSLESLLVGHERGDWRLPNDNRFQLYVAASYALKGSPDAGMDVLNDRFQRAGLRKQYAQAFDYLASLIDT